MLYELTGTYGASILAARAPKGLFGPKSLIFVTPFWAEFYFGRNIGMWGVQSAAVECPAHTALLQSIWNHPAGEKGQKLQFERPPRTPNLQLQFGPIFLLGMYLLREGRA